MNSSSTVEILVVEDDPNDQELILRVLKKHGMANKLVLLKDGAEALDFLFPKGKPMPEEEHPKIILLDLKLPKVDCLEVLRKVKSDERTKMIPVVILTSSREDRDLTTAYGMGVNSYVTKPIRFDEFAKVVSDLGMYWILINRPPEE